MSDDGTHEPTSLAHNLPEPILRRIFLYALTPIDEDEEESYQIDEELGPTNGSVSCENTRVGDTIRKRWRGRSSQFDRESEREKELEQKQRLALSLISTSGVETKIGANRCGTQRLHDQADSFRLSAACTAYCVLFRSESQSIIETCLYTAPYLKTLAQLQLLTSCIHAADVKWDSLKRFPDSTPGRYVRYLDLRRIKHRSFPAGSNSNVHLLVNVCIVKLLPLLPQLKVLHLPKDIALSWSAVQTLTSRLSCGLRVLTGVQFMQALDREGNDPITSLCRAHPTLRVLEVWGMGSTDVGFEYEDHPQDPVDLLPEIRKLTFIGVKRSLLLQTLLRASLPRLRILQLASYHTSPGDLTTEFLQVHGQRLHRLVFLPLPDWPQLILPIPSVLSMCPKLHSLTFVDTAPPDPIMFEELYHHDPESGAEVAVSAFSSSTHAMSCPGRKKARFGHHLQLLVLPRWTSTRENPPNDRVELFFQALATCTPPNLRMVAVDDFTWVKKDLGRMAMETGLNGKLRRLSANLTPKNVFVVDKNGDLCPSVSTAATPVSRRPSGGSSLVGLVAGVQRLGMKGFLTETSRSKDADDEDYA